jgi:hypothetical protein
MKSLLIIILGIVLGVVAIAIRLLGLIPSGLGNFRRSNPVGNRFLLGVGVVSLAMIFVWFWFVMKAR